MPLIDNPRLANLLGCLACAAMLVYALYAQHALGLAPCPLCVFQRIAIFGLGLLFLLAALQAPGPVGRRVYGTVQALAAVAGGGVAARHVWLQHLPPEQVPACGPGLDFMLDSFGLGEVLRMVLSGSGECAEVDWSFLGLSMPAWVLICVALLGLYGLWINWRRLPG